MEWKRCPNCGALFVRIIEGDGGALGIVCAKCGELWADLSQALEFGRRTRGLVLEWRNKFITKEADD